MSVVRGRRSRAIVGVTVSVGLALAAVSAGGSGVSARSGAIGSTVSPSTPPAVMSAWVDVRKSHSTYTPAAIDQGNSAHMTNTVTHEATGGYVVSMPGVGSSGGNFQVNAVGQLMTCDFVQSEDDSGTERAVVECFGLSGHLHDAKFTLSYLAATTDAGTMAYLWADQPDVSGIYTPTANYSFDSAGGGISVHNFGGGGYGVNLGGISTDTGDVQVTAMAVSGVARACAIQGWSGQTTYEYVVVQCYDWLGNPADAQFQLWFASGEGAKGSGKGKVAYLFSSAPTAATSHSDTDHRFSQPAGTYTIKRTSAGRYTVKLSTMPAGGSVHVTAYGSDANACYVWSISTTAPQTVVVHCEDPTVAPVDSKFTLSYLR